MRGPAKKVNSREAFAAVFEEQTRRFSAFELLGLSAEHSPPTQQSSNEKELLGNFPLSSKATREIGEVEVLRPDPQGEELIPDPQVKIKPTIQPRRTDRNR